jgi:pyridoxal phosphate enzyme (YggS family)
MNDRSQIAAHLNRVRERIAVAAEGVGRDAGAVRLVLASKTQPSAAIVAAYDAGARDFGENYVQEAVAKRIELGDRPGLRWHLIGNLQSNKVRVAAATFELIHTLDRAGLAAALHRSREEPPFPVLIQVNIGGEVSKAGIVPKDAEVLINEAREMVAVQGLMTVPPPSSNAAIARRWFAELRELRDRLTAATGLPLSDLSMGMSDDYEAAIAEGATIVRLGRAVFGARPQRH